VQRNIERLLPAYVRFDGTDVERSVPERFADIVERYGDRVAVQDGDSAFTYGELDRTANRLAHAVLDRLGAGPEPIALLYRHGVRFCEAQLGVLKAGKFYAAMDPDLSVHRLVTLAKNLGTRLILCGPELAPLAHSVADAMPEASVIDVGTLVDGTESDPGVKLGPDDYAYIVYTSGSTGPPMGVVLSHRNVLYGTMSHTNAMHLCVNDRASQVCPLSSAACGGETLPILLTGATLLPFSVKARSIRRFAQWLVNEKISIYTSVPVVFRLLLAKAPAGTQFPDMRMVRLSGDRILTSDFELFRRHFAEHCLFRAALGAAEAFLYAHLLVDRSYVPTGEVMPAGYPLEGMEVFVVDEQSKRLPPGVVGEIAVKSRYLSVGYWHNDELTSERFLAPPGGGPCRIYLTRDLGRLQEDGLLTHLGRKDSRVKIYGKMVETAELEDVLLRMPEIEEAVVVPVTGSGAETFLVAYYVAKAGASPAPDAVRHNLVARFPIEVVPRRCIELSALPVTASNKVDRRRLAQAQAGDDARLRPFIVERPSSS
jgi:amino acid adenylation domain-containing protein